MMSGLAGAPRASRGRKRSVPRLRVYTRTHLTMVIVWKGKTCLVVKMERYDMVSRHEETHRQTVKDSSINFYM